jgi:hypothetical protein
MNASELTRLIVSGFGIIVASFASVIFSGLRSDIRALAAKIVSLQESQDEHERKFEHLRGVLEGKGLIDG